MRGGKGRFGDDVQRARTVFDVERPFFFWHCAEERNFYIGRFQRVGDEERVGGVSREGGGREEFEFYDFLE